MYAPARANAFWETNAVTPKDQGGGVSKFICVAVVQGMGGGHGSCGEVLDGACCAQQHFHQRRPMPFVQRVMAGGHLPPIIHGRFHYRLGVSASR